MRRRLALTGDCIAGCEDSSTVFDTALVVAVQHFQKRHGLTADGAVGAKTTAAMNVPARERAQQIRLNMERWRWLPQDLGTRYILVNIAGFELDVVEAGQITKTTRVVVGKSFRRTPVFSDRMSYIVLNPYWNVPRKLAVQDILPQIRKDPDYLSKQGIRVYRGWGDSKVSVDPQSVDWSSVSGSTFPFWLRQDPGPLNALGQVKFMFPNEFNIYLHDTPHREMFAKEERSFSSGCIRVENAVELAEFLLKDDPRWTSETVEKALREDVDKTITLMGTVDVHLLYWTAWVTDDGTLNFRNDIYERDRLLAEAMGELPPHPDDNP